MPSANNTRAGARIGEEQTFDRATLNFYENNARPYVTARPVEASPDLLAFLPRLKSASLILELGCGGGDDALATERLSHTVDATDGVSAMVAIASARLTRGARLLRFDDLNAPDHYDAVVACSTLLHVHPAGLPSILERIWTALKPGGWHFASFKTGGHPGMEEHGRYYNHIDQLAAQNAYRSAGAWASPVFDHHDGTGYFSKPARWLTVTAQKLAP